MNKIISLLMIVLLLCSFADIALACTEDDDWANCTPTQADKNWEKMEPTADNFHKLSEEGQKKHYGDLKPQEQKDYFSEHPEGIDKCLDCANDYFKKNPDLSQVPEATYNKYLQQKFGNKQVTFKVSQGMTYSEPNGVPTVSANAGGPQLVLEPGTEGGKIPPDTTGVSYDPANKKFVFTGITIKPDGTQVETRKIEVNCPRTSVQSDGSLLFEEDGEIVDTRTGAIIQVGKGNNVKFTDDGFIIDSSIINGKADGTWVDLKSGKNQFRNFNGRLIIAPTLIVADDGRVTVEVNSENAPSKNLEVSGKFTVSLEDGKIRNVLLLPSGDPDRRSSFIDPSEKGFKVIGQANIDIKDGELQSVQTIGADSEVEYGSFAKAEKNGRQHKFSGPCKIDFNADGSLSDVLLEQGAQYWDKFNDVGITHGSEKAIVFFGDFTGESAKAATEQAEGIPLVLIDPQARLFAHGKIGVETQGLRYEGLQDSASFSRRLEGNNEITKIDSMEDGDVARFTKKFKVGDLRLQTGFIAEQVAGLTGIVSREQGRINFELDENSLLLRAEIEKDPAKFALIENSLLLEFGDKQSFFGVNTEFG
ncbi:MAG: hypothetical protein KJ601_04845, partial [Nanoarchaeota archaeon]|nr:hypothetical protein [Nanoarchaeota archaeon]